MNVLDWINEMASQYVGFMSQYISRSWLLFIHGAIVGVSLLIIFILYMSFKRLDDFKTYMIKNDKEIIGIEDIPLIRDSINATKKRRH